MHGHTTMIRRFTIRLLAALVLAAALPAVTGVADAWAAEDALYSTYQVRPDETLHDIAIAHDLGFLELRAANPNVDPWLPKPGSTIILPTEHLLPKRPDEGILVNLAAMRLFVFQNGAVVATHPIGIGREGRETPLGTTTIVRKKADPTWYPPASIRAEKPDLPKVVPPGPDNPLGRHALYLGWPAYLLHGTNNVYGIGRRVSAGCLRMYPLDVERLFDSIPVGTRVEVLQQRVIAEVRNGRLYVEAHPTGEGWDALEIGEPLPRAPLTTEHVKAIIKAAPDDLYVDWDAVSRVVEEARGYPVAVSPPAQAEATPLALTQRSHGDAR